MRHSFTTFTSLSTWLKRLQPSKLSHLLLNLGLHGLHSRKLNSFVDSYWIQEELRLHGRYSPYLLEIQKLQDLKCQALKLLAVVLLLFLLGLLLCSSNHWLVQGLGISLCLLSNTMLTNMSMALWRGYRTGVVSTYSLFGMRRQKQADIEATQTKTDEQAYRQARRPAWLPVNEPSSKAVKF